MFVISLLFVTVVLPIWLILHYLTKWRTSRSFSRDDARLLEEIWESLTKMENRVGNLETILNKENSDWSKQL
ncbi:MAG: envelope stress response membrane protein PspB [Legionellales bacterium]|nr:envelope stress response membrane protein PspB [Legionellales bacterium]